jgi:ABC-type glycerol-3-phosphate transport system permease component
VNVADINRSVFREGSIAPATSRPGVRRRLGHAAIYVVLTLGAIVLGGPFVWIILSAFMGPDELMAYPPIFIPAQPTLANFASVFDKFGMALVFLNSVFVAISTTVGALAVCCPASFGFARMRFRGQELLFTIVLATMMLPAFTLLIPLWTLVRVMGMINTYQGVVFPFLASPFVLFILRQAFAVIPFELDDAARIDGADRLTILTRIILPLSVPAVITASVFTFITNWNSFLWPLIVLQRQDMWTLPIVLASLSLDIMHFWGETFAACVIFFGPVAVVYAFLQRYFVAGALRSGLNG